MSPLLVLTDRAAAEAAGRDLVTTVAAALAGGARAVLLREKDLPVPARTSLARELRELTTAAGARLGIASDPELAASLGAEWVHLAQHDPFPAPGLVEVVGRSCHNPAEARAAAAEGCAYATISPVALTVSKPGYGPALGADGVRAAVQAAPDLPLWALGGVEVANVGRWLAAGASGVAVMGWIMAAADPARVTHRLLAALHEASA